MNTIKAFKLNDDETFEELPTDNVLDKANYLREKYGELASDVANEVLDSIKHEENRMYFEIKFWEDVMNILNSKQQLDGCNSINLEDILIANEFELDTYYGTNKRYLKQITDNQNLYVRIFSDTNEIVDIEYETLAMSKYEKYNIISFQTIETVEHLKHLIDALK